MPMFEARNGRFYFYVDCNNLNEVIKCHLPDCDCVFGTLVEDWSARWENGKLDALPVFKLLMNNARVRSVVKRLRIFYYAKSYYATNRKERGIRISDFYRYETGDGCHEVVYW